MTITTRNVIGKSVCLAIILLFVMSYQLHARKIYLAPTGIDDTGDGSRSNPYKTLVETCKHATAGDSIVARGGVYGQETRFIGYSFRFRGEPDNYIVIMGDPDDRAAGKKAIFDAEVGDGHHLSAISMTSYVESPPSPEDDIAYIKFLNIVFRNGHTMGLNIDDGGEYSRQHPAHHITIESCEFYDCDPTHTQGSGLKLAGVDTFIVRNCIFRRIGHNGIDMVGCHKGLVTNCLFADNLAEGGGDDGLGITCKGGSKDIIIEKNIFKDLYMYGVSLGQSTSLQFFRPAPGGADSDGNIIDYEAKNCNAYRNLFINVGYPVTFSRSRNCKVYHNTIYIPISNTSRARGVGGTAFIIFYRHDQWPEMLESKQVVHARDGEVKNNVFYFGSPYKNRSISFITAEPPWTNEPETHVIANNIWYCHDNESAALPDWNYLDTYQWGSPAHSGNIAADPEFVNSQPTLDSDFMLAEESPAKWMGLILDGVPLDYFDREYNIPPTVGAFELYVNPAAPAAPASITIIPK